MKDEPRAQMKRAKRLQKTEPSLLTATRKDVLIAFNDKLSVEQRTDAAGRIVLRLQYLLIELVVAGVDESKLKNHLDRLLALA